MTDIVKENKEILGYGSKLDVLAGVKDGKEVVIKYHFTPVALKDIPKLTDLLDKFFESAEKEEWSDESITQSAELIHMSIKKMHPDIDIEKIKEQFTLAGIAKAVSVVMDVNDFLSEMETITKMTQGMSTMVSKKNQK